MNGRPGLAVCTAYMAVALVAGVLWSSDVPAQVANFHPCNAQPALPICQYGYGRRVAAMRWGGPSVSSGPLDPDARAKASLVTTDPAREIEKLKATTALVEDMDTGEILFARDEDAVRPIASIVKLMTALVVVDAGLDMDEKITIDASDVNVPSDLPSRLAAGTSLSRTDLLHLALASSENSAAHALGRSYPGGMTAFVQAMNARARSEGMSRSHFVEPVGLSNDSVSTARDLARLVHAASQHPLIRAFTTDPKYSIGRRTFHNTNMLVGRPQWDILASKTGTTRGAGDCLVMMVRLNERKLALVVLNAQGLSGSRFGDAVRLRRIADSRIAGQTDNQVAAK